MTLTNHESTEADGPGSVGSRVIPTEGTQRAPIVASGAGRRPNAMFRKGFTLVELLIVVIILGILAAIVVPQFSDASTDTQVSSLRTNLQTLRGQIELYRLQHGSYPTLTNFVDQMTKKTDADGTVNQTTGKFGPYLQAIPVNPLNNSAEITSNTSETAKGWYYNQDNGLFRANDGKTINGIATSTY